MNHNIFRFDHFIVVLNSLRIHFINQCERAVAIPYDIRVPIVLIPGAINVDNNANFRYPKYYSLRLIESSICWTATEAGTQVAVFA